MGLQRVRETWVNRSGVGVTKISLGFSDGTARI